MTERYVNTARDPILLLYQHLCGGISDSVSSDAFSCYLNSACQRCDRHCAAFIIYEDDAWDVGVCINLACIRDDGNGSVTQITVC